MALTRIGRMRRGMFARPSCEYSEVEVVKFS
jgi:hypothetical protein